VTRDHYGFLALQADELLPWLGVRPSIHPSVLIYSLIGQYSKYYWYNPLDPKAAVSARASQILNQLWTAAKKIILFLFLDHPVFRPGVIYCRPEASVVCLTWLINPFIPDF
jgi:hypothetical protein